MTDNISFSTSFASVFASTTQNPWIAPKDVDKLDIKITAESYPKIIETCRFFYRHDAIVSSVFNKIVDIGINTLHFSKTSVSANEQKLLEAIVLKLQEFAENMALEYLISGLVVPEITFGTIDKTQLKEYGIKRYESLQLPVSLWLRDPTSIIIQDSYLMGDPTYFVKVPDELVYFILKNGVYSNGIKDEDQYNELQRYYPEFIAKIKNGERYIKIENTINILRRKILTDTPYPTPYLTAVLEPLKHKRNLRRMDYSIASRVIAAIQIFKLGNDNYPLTDDQDSKLDELKQQVVWRHGSGKDVERIFQLFGNHTLDVSWVFPPVDVLLDEKKYSNVNDDILLGLGFPRSLIVGENEKSNSGNIKVSSVSPEKTISQIRDKILVILNRVIDEIFSINNFRGDTTLYFEPINLVEFEEFSMALRDLYETGNLSRDSFSKFYGYHWEDEINKKKDEKELLEELGIEEFAPRPFSPPPENTNNITEEKDKKEIVINDEE